MTSPDTKAIRAQMEALTGFTAWPWNADLGETTYRVKADGMNIATANFVTLLDRIPTDQVGQNVRLIAAAPDMRKTILALCDTLDDLRAEIERLQTIIGNLHTVEGKHRETANAHFHRANRLQAENERLRNFIVDFSETKFDRIDRRSPDPQDDLDPLTDYLAIEAWQEDARAAIRARSDKGVA